MDEVDGMSSGDVGGNQVLIKIIRETKNPIFCVCNDRFNQKLKSLAGVCFDVRFEKPSPVEIATRLLGICNQENIQTNKETLQLLTESVNMDIRQSLNLLQMYSKKSRKIEFSLLQNQMAAIKKDDQVAMNIFDVCNQNHPLPSFTLSLSFRRLRRLYSRLRRCVTCL